MYQEWSIDIVQVVTVDDAGSPEDALDRWPTLTATAEALARSDVRVTVLVPSTRQGTFERNSVRYEFVPPGSGPLRRPAAMLAHVAALRPSVVHVHGLRHLRQVWWLTRALAPALLQEHGGRAFAGFERTVRRIAWSGVRGIACTGGDAQAADWRPLLPTSARMFDLIEGSSTFVPGDRPRARQVGRLHGEPAVVWVGRLSADKDPLTALEAVAECVEEFPALTLTMVFNDAPIIDAVRARVDGDARLRDRVELRGALPHAELESLLRGADVFLLSSRREGCNFATIEALACGTPVVVTDLPSFRRITGALPRGARDGAALDGRVGTLFAAGDAASAATAIRAVATLDDAGRVALRTAARAHFDATLSYDAIARELRACYAALAR